jgi:hypothetical protein
MENNTTNRISGISGGERNTIASVVIFDNTGLKVKNVWSLNTESRSPVRYGI